MPQAIRLHSIGLRGEHMAKGNIGANTYKAFLGNLKMKKGYIGATRVYSAGNTVTYVMDTNISYQEEVDSEASCLSPKTFTPTKSGWTFVGWRENNTANSTVLTSKVMGDNPITLYAVFRQAVTVTYYNNSTTKSTKTAYRYYNNGNTANPSFTLAQASKSGWTARGWSTATAANGSISYSNNTAFTRSSNLTLYGCYQKTITLTTIANSSTSTKNGTAYYNSAGNTSNPTFTVSNPTKSGTTFKGWSSSASSTTITNSSISSLSLSASTTRYAVFAYADATVTSSSVLKSYTIANKDESRNLYTLDSTKYASHTVTARIDKLLTSNNTAGTIVNYAYVDGTLVRSTKNVYQGDWEGFNRLTTTEVGDYSGSDGKSFTITYAGNLTCRVKLQGYWNSESSFSGCVLTITALKLNGKTVVG